MSEYRKWKSNQNLLLIISKISFIILILLLFVQRLPLLPTRLKRSFRKIGLWKLKWYASQKDIQLPSYRDRRLVNYDPTFCIFLRRVGLYKLFNLNITFFISVSLKAYDTFCILSANNKIFKMSNLSGVTHSYGFT